MDKPVISGFQAVAPLFLQQYERYLPTAFDESMSLVEKVNKVIQYANDVGALTNGVVEKWNEVMEWILNDGLTENVVNQLNTWFNDGTLAQIINEDVFNMKADKSDMEKRSIIRLSTTQPTDTDSEVLWLEDLGEAPITFTIGQPIDGIWVQEETTT